MSLFAALPALAQNCADDWCLDDGQGPGVGVGVPNDTYILDEGTSVTVEYDAHFFDIVGVNSSTVVIRLNGTIINGWTWTAREHGGTAHGSVTLSRGGDNILEAEAKDVFGNLGSGSTTVRLQFTDPKMPVVYDDRHHNGYRDTAVSQLALAYSTTPYFSLGAPRAVTLQYNSQLANPSAYVEVDAKPEPRTAANVTAMSLQIIDDATGAVVGREFFWAKNPTGEKQRMAVIWTMRTRPTGAYNYTAAVRSYFNDGTYKEKRMPVRVLIVNESASRYGAGWTLGLPQIYGAVGGVILHEGDGVLRWYGSNPCSTICTFARPEGDFAEIEYNRSTATWTRRFNDDSVVTFNDKGRITSAADSFGRVTTFTWTDVAGTPVLTAITDPMGKRLTFAYTAGGFLQRITDPANRETAVTIDAAGHLTSLSGPTGLQVTYGANHLPDTYTDDQGTWDTNFYRGFYSSIVAPSVTIDGGASVRPTTKFLRAEWKATLLAAEGTSLTNLAPAVASGNAVEEIVDPRSHKTIIARNRYGEVTTIVDVAGNTTGFTYTRDGLVETEVHTNGRKTEYDWNARGQLVATRVDGVPDFQASYTRTDKPDYEVSGGKKSWFTWGTRGELLRTWYGEQSDSVRNGTVYQYDGIYRASVVTGPSGERTEFTYDSSWGNVGTSRVVREDGVGRTTTFTYDAKGVQYTVTNALLQRTITNHDFRNRLSEITDPLGGVTKMEYRGALLTRVVDPAGKAYGYNHNALGWLQTETFPDGSSRTFTYDADGLLRSKKDRRGFVVRFTHDTAHRPLTRSADGVPTTTYAYPDRYTTTVSNAEGTQTTAYTPDTGRLDYVKMTVGGLAGRMYELRVALDPQNYLDPVGNDVKLWHNGTLLRTLPIRYNGIPNGTGSLLQITDAGGGMTMLTYDASGKQTGTALPNGINQTFVFGADGRLLEARFNNSTLNTSQGADYSYDALSRLTKRLDLAARTEWTFGYSTLGQTDAYRQRVSMPPVGCNPHIQTCLPTWSTARSGAFTYDAVQNRTDSGAAIIPNSNRYSTFNGFTLEYDLEGNVTRKWKMGFDQRFVWNALGQLASVTTNGAVVSYGYDPSDRRVRRTADGYSRYFLYEDEDLLLELGPDGMPTRSYVHLPGTDRPLSVREYHPGNYEPTYYYLTERPGHVRALLDSTGAIIGEYAYTPFGEPISTAKGDGINQPLRFMARELDAASRLYYVRARWYDPELGRFMSEDPIGISGGINTYAYVENDPINRTDPSGLWPDCPNCLDPIVVSCNHGYDPDCDAWYESGIFETWRSEWDELTAYRPGDYLREGMGGALVRPDPVGMGTFLKPPPPPPAPRATIGPYNPNIQAIHDAQRRETCKFFQRYALGWSVLHSFGRVQAGATQGRQDPTYQITGRVLTSQGSHFGSSRYDLKMGKAPRADGGWGTSMATNMGHEAREMAAIACAGVD